MPDDAPALSVLCRLTGDGGGDASGRTAFPDLLGDVYATPYAHAYGVDGASFGTLVLDDEGPAGYLLGCLDTARFEAWREEHWWPPLRRRYPRPEDGYEGTYDEWLLRIVHEGVRPDPLWAQHARSTHRGTPRTCTSTCCRGCRGAGWGGCSSTGCARSWPPRAPRGCTWGCRPPTPVRWRSTAAPGSPSWTARPPVTRSGARSSSGATSA